jgi:hypothetical protein
MNMMILAQILIILLVVALATCLMIIRQLKTDLAVEKEARLQPYLIFSFEGPEEIFSIKNVGMAPVSLVVIEDFKVSLLLEFEKTVTLKFEPITMIEPRESVPLKFTIFDGDYPMHRDAQNSFMPHLKASSFEARLSYHDWQNTPCKVTVVKDKDRFFAKHLTSEGISNVENQ